MLSHSISIAFNMQENPPLRPQHKARWTAPHSPHIIFRTSVPRSSSKHERSAICTVFQSDMINRLNFRGKL